MVDEVPLVGTRNLVVVDRRAHYRARVRVDRRARHSVVVARQCRPHRRHRAVGLLMHSARKNERCLFGESDVYVRLKKKNVYETRNRLRSIETRLVRKLFAPHHGNRDVRFVKFTKTPMNEFGDRRSHVVLQKRRCSSIHLTCVV